MIKKNGVNRGSPGRWGGPKFRWNHTKSDRSIEITCPGMTIWDVRIGKDGQPELYVKQGVKFIHYPAKNHGYEIIGQRINAPGHEDTRMIYAQDLFQTGQCKACQKASEKSRRNAKRKLRNLSVVHRQEEIQRVKGVLKGKISQKTRKTLEKYLQELENVTQ